MITLFASTLALLAGPVAYRYARQSRGLLKALDTFVLVAIPALVAWELLPEVWSTGAWWVLAVAAAGLFGPTLVEQVLHRADFHGVETQMHLVTLVVGLGGLAVHTLIEGAALADLNAAGFTDPLAVAIVVHRIPIGLAVWWLLRPSRGVGLAAAGVFAMILCTTIGFALGPTVTAGLPLNTGTWLRALVAGSLLHVVFFRTHLEAHHGEHPVTGAADADPAPPAAPEITPPLRTGSGTLRAPPDPR